MVGKFSSRLESAAITYLANYLNRLIHSLLIMTSDEPGHTEKKEHQKQHKKSDINLITFKTGDLMRCKCSSHENEIIRIFDMLKRLSESDEEVFKIVRIKDRLEMGTRDILINALFMQRILCEIQLAVTDTVDEKQMKFDSFNHYLYELKRSCLGPIMESSCIWTHLDQRSKMFKQMKDDRDEILKVVCFRKHTCS